MTSPRRPGTKLLAALAVAALAAAALAACGPGGTSPTTGPSDGTAPTVTGAWVRPPAGSDRPAGGYLVITGGATDDALLSVRSDAAAMVELHETTTDSSGMSGMHAIHRLAIPARATIELKPGGYHLMLMSVVDGAVEVGGTVRLELTFEKAGVVIVDAEVRAG